MYDTVAKLAAVEDLSGGREQNVTLSDGAAAKAVKHLPAAYKEVAWRAHEHAQANPDEMARLGELPAVHLPSALCNVDPTITALLMAPASVQNKLEGKLGMVVKHLFRLSVDVVEAEAYPCSVRSSSSSSSATSDPFRSSAEDLVRRNLNLNNWKRAFVAMAGTNQRIASLVNGVSSQEISSPNFPRESTWWSDLWSFMNISGPGLPCDGLGNLVGIANKLVQDGVSPGAAATLVDRVIYEQQYNFDGVRQGRILSTALLSVKPTFHGQSFTDKLTPFYDDLLRQGAIARAVGPEMAVQVREAVQLALSAQSSGKRKTGDDDYGIDKSDGTVQSKQVRMMEIGLGPICFQWNGQSCPVGDDCTFQHIPGVDTTTCKKSVPCYNWDGQSCSFGSGCNFEHLPGIDTRRKAHCRDFAKGSCARGAECRFKHE